MFARNILNKYQTLKLVKSIKTLLGKDCMILIDEEGGRVTRLSKLGGPKFATAKSFGDSAKKIKLSLGSIFNSASPIIDAIFLSQGNLQKKDDA